MLKIGGLSDPNVSPSEQTSLHMHHTQKLQKKNKIVKFVKIMHFIPLLHCTWLDIITEPHPKSKNKAIAKAFDNAFYAVSSRL